MRRRKTFWGQNLDRDSAPPPAPVLPAPLRIAIYGDSFAQRNQDVTGAPVIDPQTENWATDMTTPVGGVSWGFAPWIEALSRGKYRLPYQINHGIGGFNTGQLARLSGADPTPWYLASFLTRLAAFPVALRPDAVLFQAGTNDDTAGFSAAASYANILKICANITATGIPVFVATVLPRGNSLNVASRAASPAVVDALNALLIADLAAAPSVSGLVRVLDPRTPFRDLAGQSNDILDAMVYDGLHLSASAGVLELAASYRAALDTYFPGTVGGLPATTGGPVTFNTNALMTGTGGTINRSGNFASNGIFTINGFGAAGFPISNVAPTGWTVTTTTSTGGTSSWSGIAPATPIGELTVSKVGTGDDTAIQLRFDCDLSLLNNANTRGVEAFCTVDLPAGLAVGAYFEGVAVVEVLRRDGLPIAGIRGFSAELRITEPDTITRTVRSNRIAPNGTAKMLIEDREYAGVNALVLRTPPVARKSGTYGAISFAVFVYAAGVAADVDVVVRISRAGVIATL